MTATPTSQRRDLEGRAYQRYTLVCGRVVVGDIHDDRLGLAPAEREYATIRFLDDIADGFRPVLEELVRRRGAAAKRLAERLEPLEIVISGNSRRRRRVVGRLEPPLLRYGRLRQIEFRLRKLS